MAATPHKFSSTQFNLPEPLANHVRKSAANIPDWALSPEGRESSPHVTVKWGIHSDEPSGVQAALGEQGPFKIRLGKTSHFPDSGDGDVVKAEVHSPDLHALHRRITNQVPNTSTHPTYKPHVTLAYVKRGLGRVMAEKDGHSLNGKEATVDHVIFSSKNGSKRRIPLTGKRYVIGKR